MHDQPTANRYHAILIGIDTYPNGPLLSCVNDVSMIKNLLETKLNSVNIQAFTASHEVHLDQARPPTRDNIISALEDTTSRASRGEYVYIHFSGHGTRRDHGLKYSNLSTGDLSLVVLDRDDGCEDFLSGPRLAGLIKAMVQKGLVVTLVLDCCFSASVYRNSDWNDFRYLPYNSRTSLVDRHTSPSDNATGSAQRNTSMQDNWLLNPDQYAILAACGPHENAKGGSEKKEGGKLYGALSYFLSKVLSDYGMRKRHIDLHHHLCAKFEECNAPQHPVLFGNGDQGFFGPADTYRASRLICIIERDGSRQLLAGRAHGIRDNDTFTVFPPGLNEYFNVEGACVVKVVCAGVFTSELEMLGAPRNIQTGWVAKPITLSLASFSVRLSCIIPQHNELSAQLKKRSLVPLIDTDQVSAFKIVLRNNDEYGIRDESDQEIINLPTMTRNQFGANLVCEVLEHLAQFKMVKDLTNESPTTSFQQSFEVKIRSDGQLFDPGELIEVQDDHMVEMMIKNTGQAAVYAHLYDLGSYWDVSGILRSTYETIPPRKDSCNGDPGFAGYSTKKIRMKIPPAMRHSCEDIIKIFVTSQPTSFNWLELPEIGELAKKSAEDVIGYRSEDVPDDWMALNFPIRILQPASRISE
ncbi:putative caspase [Annulohypoxylon moriforme]|nr:putative caspase [Annulohypoxylon moriforme]